MNLSAGRLLLMLALAGCGDQHRGATSGDVPASDDASASAVLADGGVVAIPDGAIPTHDGAAFCLPRTCQGKLYQCGDCIDNDGDGLIDDEDPDCLGSCQNNESGFSGNIPGQNNAFCKADCYFDQDTGSGNDQCEWDYQCDPLEVPPAFAPEAGCKYDPTTTFQSGKTCADKMRMQTTTCHDVCGPLTPNGCDCFGCCQIPPNPFGPQGVYLGSRDANGQPTCDLAHVTDPSRCKPCTIVTSCFKPCGYCELCVGKPQLPEDCFGPNGTVPDGAAMSQCPGGETPCGLTGQAPCPDRFYCVTGCCEPIIG